MTLKPRYCRMNGSKAISGSTTAERLNKELIPKVIRERYTDLTDDEVEEVRQRVILDTIFKSGEVVDDKGEPITFEPGNKKKRVKETSC